MTDINDIEQRAKDMIEKCQREKAQRKNRELADKIFHEPKRREAEKEAREKAEAEELKQMEERWNPWLEKAMRKAEQERAEYEKMWGKSKK